MKILIKMQDPLLSTSHSTVQPAKTDLNFFRRFAVVIANFPHLQAKWKTLPPEEANAFLEHLFKQEEERLASKSTKR